MDDLVAEWIKFSDLDLSAAEHLYKTMRPQPLEIICYHCQQSAEKALKAYWIFSGEKPPKTHDLKQLLEFCESNDNEFTTISIACIRLTDYGIQPRYPLEMEVTDGNTFLALQDSKKINEFVKEKMK